MSRACATCDSTNQQEPTVLVPIVGMVCRECFEILSSPMTLEGAIECPSMLTLCRRTIREFESRREKLRAKAKVVCERKPIASVN